MTEILVTGGQGQLARALADAAPDRVRVVGRPQFDFDKQETVAALFEAPPRVLVNAAAWTAVDAAEKEPEAARRANAEGPGLLAELCRRHGTRLIHISTDYVFDGAKGAPYVEGDATNPTGVYGATKLAGELAVLAALPEAVILRTAWVYATAGKNFVLTMLNAARRMPALRVVADQRGCPTNADDLAAAVLGVVDAPAWRVCSTPAAVASRPGTGLPKRFFAPRGHMAGRCRRYRRLPQPTGRRRRGGQLIAGWIAASWHVRPACGCRIGGRACIARSPPFAPPHGWRARPDAGIIGCHPAIHLERRCLPARPARQFPAPDRA